MSSEESVEQPGLVYDRIDKNRRDTYLLIVFFIILILPALTFLVEYGIVWLVMLSVSALQYVKDEQAMMGLILLLGVAVFLVMLLILTLKYRAAVDSTLHSVDARPPSQEDEDFVRVVGNLCIGSGLPVPKLYIVNSLIPNAFSIGFSPDSASIVVTRGLLNLLDRSELEGVIAHELSHIGNRDSQLNTVLTVMLRTMILPFPIRIIFWIWLVFCLPILLFDMDFFMNFPPSVRTLMGLQIILVIWTLFWPWVGRFVQRAVTRKREFLADADAALLTRYPKGLALALTKVSKAILSCSASAAKQNTGLANPALSHLFLITPVVTTSMLDSHPPVAMRVKALAMIGSGIDLTCLDHVPLEVKSTGSEIPIMQKKPPEKFYLLEQIPIMFNAAVHGIKYGFLSLLVFFILETVLLLMLNPNLQLVEILDTVKTASSIGYAIAGYMAAKAFSPERRLALLASCFILYVSWMVWFMIFFIETDEFEILSLSAKFIYQLFGGIALVIIGGICGAVVQALFTSRISQSFWRSRF